MGVRAAFARVTAGAVLAALLGTGPAAAAPNEAIQVGGPAAPGESKVAIVGTSSRLGGEPFTVVAGDGSVVLRGKLSQAPGKAGPWPRAFRADFSAVTKPGKYRVKAAGLTSKAFEVKGDADSRAIGKLLGFFAGNSDGSEPSPIHGAAHLNDAVIHQNAPAHAGQRIAIAGGWMDAGDQLHFTQSTAFAVSLLEGAARLGGPRAAEIATQSDVGVRWLLLAHPFPDAFVVQVGDLRDHETGWRDPASDDASMLPGIGQRFAYTLPPQKIGGDLGGKTAAALAMYYQRTGYAPALTAAREWYAAGALSGAPAPKLTQAGYPSYAGSVYSTDAWQDSLATGAVELFRATGESAYMSDYLALLDSPETAAGGTIGLYDQFSQLGIADACGALGAPAVANATAVERSCNRLADDASIAAQRARSNAFGMAGLFTWGTTAVNGAAGALGALAEGVGRSAAGCGVAAGARDYLLGRNPFGSSLVVGFGRNSARHPHTWASLFGPSLPVGAVVGGPAPRAQVEGEGFSADGPLQTSFATYEDEREDYVTSEPALDYVAANVLLTAALESQC